MCQWSDPCWSLNLNEWGSDRGQFSTVGCRHMSSRVTKEQQQLNTLPNCPHGLNHLWCLLDTLLSQINIYTLYNLLLKVKSKNTIQYVYIHYLELNSSTGLFWVHRLHVQRSHHLCWDQAQAAVVGTQRMVRALLGGGMPKPHQPWGISTATSYISNI